MNQAMTATESVFRPLEAINENILVNLHDAHDICTRIESTLAPRPIAGDNMPGDPARLGLLAQAETSESLAINLVTRLRSIHEQLGVK